MRASFLRTEPSRRKSDLPKSSSTVGRRYNLRREEKLRRRRRSRIVGATMIRLKTARRRSRRLVVFDPREPGRESEEDGGVSGGILELGVGERADGPVGALERLVEFDAQKGADDGGEAGHGAAGADVFLDGDVL
mmetsp:Transcript_21232/g.65525  ORF Transcript_21232/g.65525 Transcript_21232/m.65525 type:complete len:135 (+) Transcript_21232:511-915(+)